MTNHNGRTTTSTQSHADFTLDAFLASPGFVGTLAIFAVPALAFVSISLAQLAAHCGSPRAQAGGDRTPESSGDGTAVVPSPPPSPPSPPTTPAGSINATGAPASHDDTVAAPSAAAASSSSSATAPPDAKATDRIDALENALVVLYVLQLPTGFRTGVHSMRLPGGFGLFLGLPLLLAEALFALKLVRHLRTLHGRAS